MLEKKIVANIIKYLKSLDHCYCFKEHGGQYGSAGIPDIICCYQRRFYGFEVKNPKGKPTELQTAVIKKINGAQGTVGIVRSVDDEKELLRIGGSV